MSNMTSPDQEEAPEYFYLYRISYAWTSAIGCLITVLVGIITGGIIGILVKYFSLRLSSEVDMFIVWRERAINYKR